MSANTYCERAQSNPFPNAARSFSSPRVEHHDAVLPLNVRFCSGAT